MCTEIIILNIRFYRYPAANYTYTCVAAPVIGILWQIKKKKRTHILDFTNELKVPEFLLRTRHSFISPSIYRKYTYIPDTYVYMQLVYSN